ncbi:MAG: hypothetical protein J6T47_06860 [Lachnospiraceae bacterium]|nr:hypothetical protein [Lachnospiraceae bacterium]
MLAGWNTGYTIASVFTVVLIISLLVASGRGDIEVHRRRPKEGRRVSWREAAAAWREEKQQERERKAEEKRKELEEKKENVTEQKKEEGKQDLPQNEEHGETESDRNISDEQRKGD